MYKVFSILLILCAGSISGADQGEKIVRDPVEASRLWEEAKCIPHDRKATLDDQKKIIKTVQRAIKLNPQVLYCGNVSVSIDAYDGYYGPAHLFYSRALDYAGLDSPLKHVVPLERIWFCVKGWPGVAPRDLVAMKQELEQMQSAMTLPKVKKRVDALLQDPFWRYMELEEKVKDECDECLVDLDECDEALALINDLDDMEPEGGWKYDPAQRARNDREQWERVELAQEICEDWEGWNGWN